MIAQEWVTRPGFNNQALYGKNDAFYVSYNRDTGADPMGVMMTSLGNVLGADLADGEETALVREEDGKAVFRILEGDFRKEYEKLVGKGWNACYKFFKENQAEHGSSWSTREEDR